jgi:hypothetical protein
MLPLSPFPPLFLVQHLEMKGAHADQNEGDNKADPYQSDAKASPLLRPVH